MAINDINPNLFDQYVNASRQLLAELSKVVGDSYDPRTDIEITNAIHRVISISQSVLTMTQSLHAHHPSVPTLSSQSSTTNPSTPSPQAYVPAEQVTGIPPAAAPPGTPLQAETPPASV